ncbi:MAG: PstS family phosphate ABC transporter substrate-binding protein [Candidatus Nanopelagicales bacterium]|nr:PstS family phosphate ABC transporter substrate-binding protein [Candidatus Nanopelagicales bacterium]MDZ4249054.1 PstS family phosphate ABC transporter substrate-binding protein [Candidatus Nanopelagicales bacterium]
MRTRRALTGVLAAAVAGTLVLAACGKSDGSGGSDASGTVTADGSSTVGPLTSVAAELFRQQAPNVNVTVGTSGSGGGFEKFCRDETDISDASRPIKDVEIEACKKNSVRYTKLVVANDALTVVVNKSNSFAKCLTTGQLKKIWEPGSKINNWNQVDSKFPNLPLELFGPGTDSGTFDYFTDEINGEEGASRTDYTPSEDDNVLVQGVAGSAGGLGYFGYTYFEENPGKLNAVEINGGSGCVAPSPETSRDGTYTPLSRPLFIYPSINRLSSNPSLRQFLDYYVDNNAQIAKDAQYIPLSDKQRSELKTAYADALKEAGVSSSPAVG